MFNDLRWIVRRLFEWWKRLFYGDTRNHWHRFRPINRTTRKSQHRSRKAASKWMNVRSSENIVYGLMKDVEKQLRLNIVHKAATWKFRLILLFEKQQKASSAFWQWTISCCLFCLLTNSRATAALTEPPFIPYAHILCLHQLNVIKQMIPCNNIAHHSGNVHCFSSKFLESTKVKIMARRSKRNCYNTETKTSLFEAQQRSLALA